MRYVAYFPASLIGLSSRNLRQRGEWFHVDIYSIRLVARMLCHSAECNTLTRALDSFYWRHVGL